MSGLTVHRDVGGNLTAHGKAADGTPSLRPGFTPPEPVLEADMVPAARWLNGELANGLRYPNAVITAPLRIVGANEAAVQAIVTAWRDALARLDYLVDIDVHGDAHTWRGRPGRIVLTNGKRRPFAEIGGDDWTVTIPVHPIPVA